jgi:hypothetical protein
LQQDPLENFFSVVRQQHGCCKNPSTEQFENGLRHTYITSISKLSSNSNCEEDFNIMLTTLRSMSNVNWGARLENRNKNIKIQNSNNQKLKNICHV